MESIFKDPEVEQALERFTKELERAVERKISGNPARLLTLLASHIDPPTIAREEPPPAAVNPHRGKRITIDRNVMVQTLREHGGVKRKAAAALGITVPTLNKYLKRRRR